MSHTGLVLRIALFVLVGIPLLGVGWEMLNELIAGHWNSSQVLRGTVALALLFLLWRFLAASVQRWDRRLS